MGESLIYYSNDFETYHSHNRKKNSKTIAVQRQ